MEFTHIMEMAITAAADSTGSVPPVILIRKRSVKAAIAEAREISINVRRPAEWRFFALSHPIMAEKSTEIPSLNSME